VSSNELGVVISVPGAQLHVEVLMLSKFSRTFRHLPGPSSVSQVTNRSSPAAKLRMKKRIEDEFSDLPISRQRKYQLRMQRDNRCTECGEPAVQGSRCLKHLVKARERQRKKRGLKRRYYGTLSYKLEGSNKEK
jgi:hypothetical protein